MEEINRAVWVASRTQELLKSLLEDRIAMYFGLVADLDDGIWLLYADAMKTYFFVNNFVSRMDSSSEVCPELNTAMRWAGQSARSLLSHLGSNVDLDDIPHSEITYIAEGVIAYYLLAQTIRSMKNTK